MSRDYNQICQKIHQANEQLYSRDTIIKEVSDLKRDIKILSQKLDKIYDMIVNMINGGEF
jgi:hypothetical protein